MTYGDSVLAALGAIRVNVLRSVLTSLGIIIGVAAVIVMISVGAGAQKEVDDVIKKLGSNLVILFLVLLPLVAPEAVEDRIPLLQRMMLLQLKTK